MLSGRALEVQHLKWTSFWLQSHLHVGLPNETWVVRLLQRSYTVYTVLLCYVCHRLGHSIILSRASEVGSPTNHLGSGQRQDTDQGSFGPLTGGLPKIEKDEPYTGPVLLRQGDPGTSQYCHMPAGWGLQYVIITKHDNQHESLLYRWMGSNKALVQSVKYLDRANLVITTQKF